MDIEERDLKCIGKTHLMYFVFTQKKGIRFEIQEYPHISLRNALDSVLTISLGKLELLKNKYLE